MTNYNIYNYSKLSSGDSSSRRYDWCVFVDEDQVVLDSIESVKYILHPTFPNPERIVRSKKNRFALYSNGWQTFQIMIEIKFLNGERDRAYYQLDLQEDNWPKTSLVDESILDEQSIQVYEVIKSSSFDWRKLDTIISKSNLPEKEVMTSIGKLQDLNLIRESHYLSVDKKTLFGITEKVGNQPSLNTSKE